MEPADYLQEYLVVLDEGMGTAYERYALNHFLYDNIKAHDIKTVCDITYGVNFGHFWAASSVSIWFEDLLQRGKMANLR